MHAHVLLFVQHPLRTRVHQPFCSLGNFKGNTVREGKTPGVTDFANDDRLCTTNNNHQQPSHRLSTNDAGLLDVEFVSQLKAHHQMSLPIVLDSDQHVLRAAAAQQQDAMSSVLDVYMKLADTAPVMGTVTLGMTKPLSDRELANLCMLMAAMSKHLAHDWKTFFDIADPRHTITRGCTTTAAGNGMENKPAAFGGDEATAIAPLPIPAPMDVSSDEHEYASESEDDDTSSTRSDAAFDGTMVTGDATSQPSGSNANTSGSISVQQLRSGTKREGCREDGLRSVRRRHDDSDDGGDDWHSSGGPANSGAGSHGSTAFGGSASAATSGGVVSTGKRPCNSGTFQHALGDIGKGDQKPYVPVDTVGMLLKMHDANTDRQFNRFYSQQFLLVRCIVGGVAVYTNVHTHSPTQTTE